MALTDRAGNTRAPLYPPDYENDDTDELDASGMWPYQTESQRSSRKSDRRERRRQQRAGHSRNTYDDTTCDQFANDDGDGDRRALRRQPADRTAVRRRDDGQESFKCGHCKTFVGPTVSGGRHRNHCPVCLYSRHVDGNRPGDRTATCRSLMAPVGTFFRPKGEQVILHRCLGCGLERHNRVAADDHPVPLLRLELVPPRLGGKAGQLAAAATNNAQLVNGMSHTSPQNLQELERPEDKAKPA